MSNCRARYSRAAQWKNRIATEPNRMEIEDSKPSSPYLLFSFSATRVNIRFFFSRRDASLFSFFLRLYARRLIFDYNTRLDSRTRNTFTTPIRPRLLSLLFSFSRALYISFFAAALVCSRDWERERERVCCGGLAANSRKLENLTEDSDFYDKKASINISMNALFFLSFSPFLRSVASSFSSWWTLCSSRDCWRCNYSRKSFQWDKKKWWREIFYWHCEETM